MGKKVHQSQIAKPLNRSHMQAGFEISLDRYLGRDGVATGYSEGEQRIPGYFGPSQPMHGFEKTYRNIIDYIVRITYRIWEDRDVEYIGETYSEDSKVYDDYGLQRGSAKIISDSHHRTGAFSNIRLIADEVIWAGDDKVGYHTSHRTLIRGTNDGDSKYGPATGRDVDVLVIANCVALQNEIFLEHVLYNNSSLLTQLGHDLGEVAIRMADASPPGWPRTERVWSDLRHAARPTEPLYVTDPVQGFDVDRFTRQALEGIWNGDSENILKNAYSDEFRFSGPTERSFTGIVPYLGLVNSLKAAFPDLHAGVDEVYWMGNDKKGYLSSVRWSATGTHAGEGIYGAPTGAPVQIWGITQQRIVDGRVVHEWMLFNELDLMMQIAAARKAR